MTPLTAKLDEAMAVYFSCLPPNQEPTRMRAAIIAFGEESAAQERVLADLLAEALANKQEVDGDCDRCDDCVAAHVALTAWREAREVVES